MSVEEKEQQILNHVDCDSSQIFFREEHIKDAINKANKNSSPGPDKITSELILNGGKQVISALTLLLQACYLIGYFPKLWKIENRTYFKNMDKATYHIENSYRSISLTNLFTKIYERILLQQATNILEENKFFEGKNLYAYQKNKNARQALLPLVEQMHEAIANGEYGIVIMADLEGAFDSVWREGALYKLHIAGINSNLLAVLSSFLTDRVCKIFVNSYQGPWLETQLSVPQGSLLSPLIFLVYTSDLTLEEEKPQSQVKLKPQESKYADHVEFWRTHKNYYQLLINIQLAIVNLQSWFYKWCISLNISKTNYMVFYNKKKKPSHHPPERKESLDL